MRLELKGATNETYLLFNEEDVSLQVGCINQVVNSVSVLYGEEYDTMNLYTNDMLLSVYVEDHCVAGETYINNLLLSENEVITTDIDFLTIKKLLELYGDQRKLKYVDEVEKYTEEFTNCLL